MALSLFTGMPGAGKTALAVSMLLKEKGTRPVFVMGIPELQIPHELVPPVAEWTVQQPSEEDAKILKPVFTFPPNSIIVIDEAQNVYRPRAATSKVPDHVAAFETHRHTGVDFWLITQHPSLLDSNVRRLVGRHFHIRSGALGRFLYEWPEVGEPDSKTSRDTSAKRRYKLPKKVFGMYKSATLHIKQKHTVPMPVWIGLAALLVLGWLFWKGYHSIEKKVDGSQHPLQQSQPASGAARTAEQGAAPAAAAMPALQLVTPESLIREATARFVGHPETAPMYDGMRQVKAMPMVSACLANKRKCHCYTQQGTKVEMDDNQCRDRVAHGVFNPYADPNATQSPPVRAYPPPVAQAAPPSGPVVVTLGNTQTSPAYPSPPMLGLGGKLGASKDKDKG